MKNFLHKAVTGFKKSLTPEQAFLRGYPFPIHSFGAGGTVRAYEKSAVAYSCIRRLATDAGNAPFLLLSDPDDFESEVPDSHPIAQLFNRPNPWYSTVQYMEHLYMMLNLRGEFFIVFDNPANPKEMIQFYDPLFWKAMVTQDYRLGAYTFLMQTSLPPGSEGAVSLSFSTLPSDIIHHRFNDPSNPFRGQSPLQAASKNLWTSILGDDLATDLMYQGGEQGIVYQTTEKLTPKQEEELTASLKARRRNNAKIANDMLLTGGMEILDPKFTGFDYDLFNLIAPADQKVVQVYGLSPSLIGRDDEPNYATFEGRLRVYWRQTLLPMMTAVESTFDKFFEQFGVYFRYDKANIAGLQDDFSELAKTALVLYRGNVPWRVIDERLKMGLDVDSIPEADQVVVPATMVSLEDALETSRERLDRQGLSLGAGATGASGGGSEVQTGEIPEQGAEESEESAENEPDEKLPDYATIVKRQKEISTTVERNKALAGLERAVAQGWRKQNVKYRAEAVAVAEQAMKENITSDLAARQFEDRFRSVMVGPDADFNIASVELIQPRHISSAGVGETSVELLVRRLEPETIKEFQKDPGPYLSDKSIAFIMERENLVVGLGEKLFADIMAAIWDLIEKEGELSDIASVVRHVFNVSLNRAATIARTEVGTAFNVGRMNNMIEQGFGHHEWMTNIDEFTRPEHRASDGEVRVIGDLFSSGLAYPQDPTGRPEQVINCRCLTIPITKEQFDERS